MKNNISICIIGKNEEKHIGNCLKALEKLPFPIIYTDTGSTDQTISIASHYTDQIFHYAWNNDFSGARNFCASKAKTDWIWALDCDEYLDNVNIIQIQTLCKKAEQSNQFFIGMIRQKDAFSLQGETCYSITRLGRFYHRQYCHYTGIIHEQIVPLKNDCPIQYQNLDALIIHHSYNDPTVTKAKAERNIALIKESLSQNADPYLYYQLGQAYSSIGETASASNAYSMGLSFDLNPSLSYVQSMVEAYGYTLLDLKKYSEALSFTGIEETFSTRADFVFLMGLIYMNNALFDRAISTFEKATHFSTCVVEGVNSYRAYYNIGVIFEVLGQITEAKKYYNKCEGYEPALSRIHALTN